MMGEAGINCKECGWPMANGQKFCGHCGAKYQPKKEDKAFKILGVSIKVIVFIVSLPFLVILGIIAFPIGTIGAFGILYLMYHKWFGKGRHLTNCFCCGKEISKEANICPKCGCTHPQDKDWNEW